MNGKCFELGTIQAFLDGETTPDVSVRLTEHIADCDACARLMAEADEETSVVFSALGRELDVLVPTQRLWMRINETIEIERGGGSVWQRLFASVRASLLNPSIPVAAGILLVLGIFAIVVSLRDGGNGPEVVNVPSVATDATKQNSAPAATIAKNDQSEPLVTTPTVESSNLPQRELEKIAVQTNARDSRRQIVPQRAVYSPDSFLPGEESYVKTIADLKQSVDGQKDAVFTPSSRVSYERDMAVVNDSIERMRDVVKKNPRNQAARQVLYASYQDKIDLLNSVAQREELIASMR